MNKIIRENYPASKLPEDLREGIDPAGRVTVTITQEERLAQALSLEEIFASRRPPFKSKAEIDAEIRAQRDEWNG